MRGRRRVRLRSSSRSNSSGFEKLPRDLEGDERLARAGGQRQQDAVPAVCDRLHHALDRRCPDSSGWTMYRPCPEMARRRSGRARRSALAKVRFQSSSGVG